MPRSAAEALYPDGPSNEQGPMQLAMMIRRKGEPDIEQGFEGMVPTGKGGGGPGKAPPLTQTQKAVKEWAEENVKTKEPWKPGDPIPEHLQQKPWEPGDPSYDKWAQETQQSIELTADNAVNNIYSIAKSFVSKWGGKAPTPKYPGDISAVKPINWLELQNKYAKVDLPEKAIEQGYNPNMPIYKGGSTPELRRQLPDPSKKQYERGQFFAEDPEVAGAYGYSHEYVARPKNPAVVDMGGRGYSSDDMHRVVERARDKGHDLLVVRNILDIGGGGRPQNQVVVIDPAIVRSPKAKFDPGSMHISDVLSGILAAAGTAKVMKELDPEKKQ